MNFTLEKSAASLSMLARHASGSLEVVRDPFPHLVVDNALDAGVYDQLEAQYPQESLIRSGKSVANRHQLMARDIVGNSTLHPLWRDFVRHHISATFFHEILTCFAPWIRRLYPWLEQDRGRRLEDFTVGLRDPDAACLPDICLDCQPGLNTVTLTPATPRTAHLDASNKLLTGLLYMRCPEDRTSGGDFVLYKLTSDRPRFDTPTTIHPDDLEVACTVPYRRNCAVFFLNSPRSVHGVTVRDGTSTPRRLVNWVAGCYTLERRSFFPSPPTPEVLAATRF